MSIELRGDGYDSVLIIDGEDAVKLREEIERPDSIAVRMLSAIRDSAIRKWHTAVETKT